MKRCEDCVFFDFKTEYSISFGSYKIYMCGHESAKIKDPVQRKHDRVRTCDRARLESCGKSATFFKKKEKSPS